MANKQITKAEKHMNRILTIIAWVFIAIALGFVAWFYVFSRSHVNTNDAQVRQFITPIASKVSGYIQEIRFVENQYVHQGDTLLVIDNRELKQHIAMAMADLQGIKDVVNSQEQMAASRVTDTHIVDANMESAKIDLWRTELEYTRFKNLVEQKAATQQQFEQVEAHYKQAQAKLNTLAREKASALQNATAEQAKVAPIRSQVMQRQVNLANARLNFTFSYVVAPYDGWVGAQNVQIGQLINQGQALVQVVSKERWVVANFKETQLGEIDLNKPVTIKSDAYPKLAFAGKILSLSPASGSEFALIKPNNATGNFVKIEQRYPVKIQLLDSPNNEKLRTGMNVEIAAAKQ